MIGRKPWLSLARFTDPRQKRERKTLGEWLCSKGWHWWRRNFRGWAYGSDATHYYRVRFWECARDGCREQFTGPKELLGEHDGL